MRLEIFDRLAALFNKYGHRLYLIGGSSRDILLGVPLKDYDFATDATPDEMKAFLPEEANYRFASFGSVLLRFMGVHVDITTLRVEGPYGDYRHPRSVRFVRTLEEDYIRRDFSINAIYIDEKYQIHDFAGGLQDLKNGIIRFIGDPEKRIQEDPLRILRAERFRDRLGFRFAPETEAAIKKLHHLVSELSVGKVDEERRKALIDLKKTDKEEHR